MPPKHINISTNENCCGCNACQEACPKRCIEMRPDKMGLLYPFVDTSQCIDCGRCVHTCPFIKPYSPLFAKECYAANNKDDTIRLSSSSGGVFIVLAQQIISRGGVVFGAVFAEDWSVVHTYTETMDGVTPMMGSKYVQSNTCNTFGQAKQFLEQGREVLYTGTPCQIAGLKHFLCKDYSNLLAVELICHGVPAPGVWQSYLKERLVRPKETLVGKNMDLPTLKGKPMIVNISFRDKKMGWGKYGFTLRILGSSGNEENAALHPLETFYEVFNKNHYMAAFLRNWSLRPSCYACKAKKGTSGADITIGDFWGIDKLAIIENDDKGISCVVCRTRNGCQAIKDSINMALTPVEYESITRGNPSLEKSVVLTSSAKRFQSLFPRKGFFRAMHKTEHPPFFIRGINFIKRHIDSLR